MPRPVLQKIPRWSTGGMWKAFEVDRNRAALVAQSDHGPRPVTLVGVMRVMKPGGGFGNGGNTVPGPM